MRWLGIITVVAGLAACDDSSQTGSDLAVADLSVAVDLARPADLALPPDLASGNPCGEDMCLPHIDIGAPTCIDGIKNGTEVDTDCGGLSCLPCGEGKACLGASDCASVVCTGGTCQAPSCTDGVKNGEETAVDCGGSKCEVCKPPCFCASDADCPSLVCRNCECLAAACDDGVKNGGETDVDCGGGKCDPCDDGRRCKAWDDCVSGQCAMGACIAATCDDRRTNGAESDVDCGGGRCPGCPDGKSCGVSADCTSGVCDAGRCVAASCDDKVRNGSETDIDCGGKCAPCEDNRSCLVAVDCDSNVCDAGRCSPPTCDDKVANGGESDVDCGGGAKCAPCGDGKTCKLLNDCVSRVCAMGKCAAPACDDAMKNGVETDVDCGGGQCSPCADNRACLKDIDCASHTCKVGKCYPMAQALAAEILVDAPTGYWPLDESAGTVAYDKSGQARNGTYGGQVVLGGAGLAGKAVDLQGKGWMSTAASLGDLMRADTGTVVAVVRAPKTFVVDASGFPSHQMPHVFSGQEWFMGASIGEFGGVKGVHFWNFYSGGSFDLVSIAVAPEAWVHVAWVQGGGKLTGYVNGKPLSVATHGPTAHIGTLGVGRMFESLSPPSTIYPSQIQHVATFKTALGADRILAQARTLGLAN